MKDLGTFIVNVEDVVESELESLKNYIIKKNESHAPILPLKQFYKDIYDWAEKVYNDRAALRTEKSPSPLP